jgi:hypothetical protein
MKRLGEVVREERRPSRDDGGTGDMRLLWRGRLPIGRAVDSSLL